MYQLIPRKKEFAPLEISETYFHILLVLGVGLPVSIAESFEPNAFSYVLDNTKRNPFNHEGYYVAVHQSIAMGLTARGILFSYNDMKERWDHFSDTEKIKYTNSVHLPQYWRLLSAMDSYFRFEVLVILQKFQTFAMEAGGFWIR